ncbi:TPA: hypothetical protein ACTNJK_001244 [Legionella pneumophila]|uniref:hypothetical protein n=1 Tax=Legionella sp. PATHC039 TaxID=2992042 RepID=UPI00077829B1|nr:MULTISPECIES: hypothetical protein [Legionella]HAT8857857.1 hypothetical protein [Legionella pneumophila subsp. pneumophila]MCW8395194.1 hypothetical protein [Legionella sp. PATHC039]HAT7072394.1 hypothetical protein [Legionella pneumophila]HAT8641104.1 hypothetical protein [Legionella pneumophila]HAT8867279.1 hypothetical protein [Legionella pneumophila subsp. pneumophila]
MSIEPVPSNRAAQTDQIKIVEEVSKPEIKNMVYDSALDAETKQALDKATGLLQTIITEKISDKVLRKMPSDEYLQLLSLLDDIISGSIDKHV